MIRPHNPVIMRLTSIFKCLVMTVLFCLTSIFTLYSQEQAYLLIEGQVVVGKAHLGGVNVSLFFENKKVEQVRTLEDGSFELMLRFDRKYILEISKFGFVTKKFIFNTEIPEGVKKDNIFSFPMMVELFPPFEEIDTKLLENPLAEIEYDEETMMFAFDLESATEIMRKVQALQQEITLILEAKAKLYKLEFDNAETAFKQRNYKVARDDYKMALDVYPEKTADLYIDVEYIRKKIASCERTIAEREGKAKEKQSLKEYNDLMAKADKAYDSKFFDEAIVYYEQAKAAFPAQEKPGKMIDKINSMISDNVFVTLKNDPFVLNENTEKKLGFTPVKSIQRSGNFLLIKMKNTGTSDCKVFVKFGKGAESGGGFVVKELKKDKAGNHMIRLSANDKWMRMDANWISIYPEGSSIEVELVQISRVL